MELKTPYRTTVPPIGGPEAKAEVDATPTASGMQIPVATPVTYDGHPSRSDYSPTFESWRYQGLVAGNVVEPRTPLPGHYWVVFVNTNTAAAATVRVEQGSFDVVLVAGGHVKFPSRSDTIRITVAGGGADVSVSVLGDDDLQF